MVDGLFGQVFLWVFECLPYLYEKKLFPAWNIETALYGVAIPGTIDLAYVPPQPKRTVKLVRMRELRRHVLGNDFTTLGQLWQRYFRIPERIERAAAEVGPLDDALGVHYRGNDKQSASWDTNPVDHADYATLIKGFLNDRPELKRVFLATDDVAFPEFLRNALSVPTVCLGAAGFHKAASTPDTLTNKADRALLDCVLLSRCRAVLLTSSALPSFAKILNPKLEIYRVAASKFFTNTPYFPVAYIPVYRPHTDDARAIIERLMEGDWTRMPAASRFSRSFSSRPYWPFVLRLLYTTVRGFPGMRWLSRLPTLFARLTRSSGRLPW